MLTVRQTTRRFIAAVVALGCIGCESQPEGQGDETAAAVDTTTQAGTTENAFSLVTTIAGFSAPEAARYDGEQDVWFVSNINGNPSEEDNNGFISRMRQNGQIDSLKFIEGGRNGVTLNAPKGMILSGDTLWVADITVARAFNARTGAPIASITAPGATMLNDLALGPDGSVYITDTGVKFGVENAQPQPSRIYRVSGGRITQALQAEALQGPNGIVWDGGRNAFVIGSMMGDSIFSWAPGDSAPRGIASGAGQWDGLALLADGRLLATSWTDSSLYVMEGGSLSKVVSGVNGPAAIGVDSERNQVAIPSIPSNEVRIYRIP